MSTRLYRRKLPEGWYPHQKEAAEAAIGQWQPGSLDIPVCACIIPHAGWYFSGDIAYKVLTTISVVPDVIAVIGGHLSKHDPVLLLDYDYFETPFGTLKTDTDLVSTLLHGISMETFDTSDNSVEIQLPLVKNRFKDSEVVCLRVPPSKSALQVAKIMYKYKMESNKKILIIGSTDLTHYGSNYRFIKDMDINSALAWVRDVNDHEFISACLTFNSGKILEKGINDHAACSSGAALCAMEYANLNDAKSTRLIAYGTSFDKHPSSSFVGYAGIVYY